MSEVTYTESSFELPEPDEWLPGQITRVEDGDDYGYGPTIKIIIELDGDIDPINDEPRETWAMCSAKLTPRSKLYGWLKGIDSELIPAEGGTVNLDVLAGRRVDTMFEHVESDNGTRARVTKLRASKTKTPLREKQKRAAAAKTPPPTDDVF